MTQSTPAAMRPARLVVLAALVLLAWSQVGCAGAHVQRDGTMHAYALGDASVERCIEPAIPPADPAAPRPRVCTIIRGGVVSTGVVSGVVAILGGGAPWD